MEIASHEGDALGVEGAEVGVREETSDVGFSRFLEGSDGGGLPAETVFVASGELTDEALEGGLAHEEISGLLVLLDLAEGDSAGSPAELLGAGGLGGLSLSLAGLLLGLGDGGGLCAGHDFLIEVLCDLFSMKNVLRKTLVNMNLKLKERDACKSIEL